MRYSNSIEAQNVKWIIQNESIIYFKQNSYRKNFITILSIFRKIEHKKLYFELFKNFKYTDVLF
jgi:hypothetical protein